MVNLVKPSVRIWIQPLRIYVPAGIFWAIINVPSYPWYHGSILKLILYWATTGLFVEHSTNSIFPWTFALAGVSFIFALVRLRRFKVNWGCTFLLATSMPFFFVGGFEAVYQNLAFFFRPEIFMTDAASEVLLSSWILLGLATAPYWRVTRGAISVVLAIAIGFGFWVALGYPQIYESGIMGEYALILNLFTKSAFFLLPIVLLYEGTNPLGSAEWLEKPRALPDHHV